VKKIDDLFLVVTLKTQVSTVTTNAQNALQHFQGAGASALKTFYFFEGVPVFIEGGACTMAQWSVQARTTIKVLVLSSSYVLCRSHLRLWWI